MEAKTISVYIKTESSPIIPITYKIPFMVNIKEDGNIERVVPRKKGIENIPRWMIEPKKQKWVCEIYNQVIECAYYRETKVIVCKSTYKPGCEDIVHKMFDIVKISEIKSKVYYKGLGEITLNNRWNYGIYADIITNNPEINNYMAINEINSILSRKKSIYLLIKIGDEYIKGALTLKQYSNKKSTEYISVKLSKAPDTKYLDEAYKRINRTIQIYEEQYRNIIEYYHYHEKHDNEDKSVNENRYKATSANMFVGFDGIKELRNEVPELFVKNYSRECPELPVIVKDEYTDMLASEGYLVIKYPKEDTEYTRYYTSKDRSKFVGLKVNRLSNSDKFPYLVTCYKQDHIKNPNTCTYAYYNGTTKSTKNKTKDTMPRSINFLENMYSIKNISTNNIDNKDPFINALEYAAKVSIDRSRLVWCPQVTKQELWEKSDDEIMNTIRGTKGSGPIIGSKYFRYFEELLEKSIHIMTFIRGKKYIIPNHVPPYVWGPPYSEHIIMFESVKILYGKTVCKYRVLFKKFNENTIFYEDDFAVKMLTENKAALSVLPLELESDQILSQIIDEKGKCRIVRKTDNKELIVMTRPYCAPTISKLGCFLDDHIDKMNNIKNKINVKPVDVNKCSTEDFCYFPDNDSFFVWLRNLQNT